MVMTELRNNADFSKLPNDHPARAYKNIQNRPTIAKPFDDTKETILLIDASRLHGLGYALVQKSRKGELTLIQC